MLPQILSDIVLRLSQALSIGLLLLCPVLAICLIMGWIRLANWVAQTNPHSRSDRAWGYVGVTLGAAASIVAFFALSLGIAFFTHSWIETYTFINAVTLSGLLTIAMLMWAWALFAAAMLLFIAVDGPTAPKPGRPPDIG